MLFLHTVPKCITALREVEMDGSFNIEVIFQLGIPL